MLSVFKAFFERFNYQTTIAANRPSRLRGKHLRMNNEPFHSHTCQSILYSVLSPTCTASHFTTIYFNVLIERYERSTHVLRRRYGNFILTATVHVLNTHMYNIENFFTLACREWCKREWEMIDMIVAKKDAKSSKSIICMSALMKQCSFCSSFLTLAATNIIIQALHTCSAVDNFCYALRTASK